MDENFIPYEQIQPLLIPGMTGGELAVALKKRLGIPDSEMKKYRLDVTFFDPWLPLSDLLKHGLRLVRDNPGEVCYNADKELAM